MKTNHLFSILFLFLCAASVASCRNDEAEERKITGYREYDITVASKKLPGITTSCGNSLLAEVYAVKQEASTAWKALGAIEGFDYAPGYEYQLRISETNYLDYNMAEPAWTEYRLLEVASKEEKNSENLPPNFIPDWYYEEHCAVIDSEFQYAIDAAQEAVVENDLTAHNAGFPKGLRCYIPTGFGHWFLLDATKNVAGQGILKSERKDCKEFPEAYKLIPLRGEVLGCMQWSFVQDPVSEDAAWQCDVFVCTGTATKTPAPVSAVLWLYKDLTPYYQAKYPEADVRTVVICRKVNIP